MYIVRRSFVTPDGTMKVGDTLPAAVVDDQTRRGNLPDLIANGYIEAVDDEPQAEPEAPINQWYNALTVAELREMAKDAGVDGYYKLKKAELIEALTDGDN